MRRSLQSLLERVRAKAGRRPPRASQLDETSENLVRLGNELEDSGKVAEALELYRRATDLVPTRPRPHMNMGNALRRLERFDQALAAQRRAIECEPGYAPAHFNLALLLAQLGDRRSAKNELLQALGRQPTMVEARIVLADIYESEERFGDAEAQLVDACRTAPTHAGLALNYGQFCFRRGRLEEAHRLLKRAQSSNPDMLDAQSLLLMWSTYRDDREVEIAREHFRVGAAMVAAGRAPCTSWPNAVNEEKRLRIGYVSGDFMPHPVPLFVRPVLEQRNAVAFETFCYSNSDNQNEVAEQIKRSADHWREIRQLDDQQVVELIRDDHIDVLVDLSGHTARHRLQVFARHPAPVQATWLGYLNTTGLPTMDYRICDAYTDPPGSTERLHTERLVRMPHSQWCYAPWYETQIVHEPHAASPDAIVFGSFNQLIKITPTTLSLWSRILDRVPEATLVVFDVGQAAARKTLLLSMRDHGIDTSRVTLRQRLSLTDYFAAIGEVDVALDTTPYNGATTTLDALWMGVPVVALRGERATARSSYSILKTLGADELIALNVEDYIDVNVGLAKDRAARRLMRQTIRARLAASPLMETRLFTRALEECYREMWRAWCRDVSTVTTPTPAACPSRQDCA